MWKWSRSVKSDLATPWTLTHQAPPSMGFSRQEYWSGLPFPSPLNIFRTWKIPSLTSGSTLCRSHPDKASSVEFSSVTQACLTLCNPMDCSMPAFPVHHQFLELAQTHVHQGSDVIQPSHPLLSPTSPAFNLSQHQGLFKWVSSSYQVAKVLEFQLQHQSFQWTPRTDLV